MAHVAFKVPSMSALQPMSKKSPSMGCVAKRPERRSRPSDLFSILLRIRVERIVRPLDM